mgnify:CR=1 FL=1
MRPYFYHLNDQVGCVANRPIPELEALEVERFPKQANKAIVFFEGDPAKNVARFPIHELRDFQDHDHLNRLKAWTQWDSSLVDFVPEDLPVYAVNLAWPKWKSLLAIKAKKRTGIRLNLVALGDVGSTLLIGLCLMGGDCIDEIGIYDRSPEKQRRFVLETNQILAFGKKEQKPKVRAIEKDEVFDGDYFVFCASKGIPPISQTSGDVRMVQLEGNRKILQEFAHMARMKDFQGEFCVVSDPVDPLCKAAYLDSNTANEKLDFQGLRPEQIHGFGLGVMYARAAYLAESVIQEPDFLKNGRAYGPHGKGLIVANSIHAYDEEKSLALTEATITANHLVRATGFKPYIAPALSSGALSILNMIRGNWHLSANFLGGVYFGAANRLMDEGVNFERLNLPQPLMDRLSETHQALEAIL